MKYGIFADVHSNLEALEVVLEALKSEGIQRYLCVGDIVGYGANPTECIDRIKELDSIVVCGNHDWASVGLLDASYFNPVASQAVLWTEKHLSAGSKKFLRVLKLIYHGETFTLVHGTLNNAGEFHYIYDAYTARNTLKLTPTNICFVGHSHIPLVIFKKQDNEIGYLLKPKIEISPDIVYVINVGSVGQPRDGDARASFCTYDSDKQIVEMKRISYDFKKAQSKIIKTGLPEGLAWRLAEGR